MELFRAAVATLAHFHVAISAKVLGVLLIAEVIVVLQCHEQFGVWGGTTEAERSAFWHHRPTLPERSAAGQHIAIK